MQQINLIELPDGLSRAQARADAMRAAKSRAELGMQRAAGAVEAAIPGWVDLAIERLRVFVRAQAGVFSIEQARAVLSQELPAVPEQRIWGRVVQVAQRTGVIAPVPRTFIAAASSNGSPKQAWKRGAKV